MVSGFFEDTDIYQTHFLDRDVTYPTLAILETSSLCNLKCPMCPRTIHKSPSGQTSGNMKVELLDRLEGLMHHVDHAVVSWFGEPLMNKQLPEFVTRLNKYQLSTHLTTNAALLDQALM